MTDNVERGSAEALPAGLEELARLALDGNRAALERLLEALQGDVYALALRMLGHREDAEDATQEILVRIVTRLSQFDFRSRMRTWAIRIAVNCILDFRRSPGEKRKQSFRELGEAITAASATGSLPETERSILIEEVKAACTLGMLQCLDRAHRAAFILGGILDLPGPEAAEILGISAALFRKRLQKARAAMVAFLRSHCGLVSDAAPCRCNRMVPAGAGSGAGQPAQRRLSSSEASFEEIRSVVRRVEEARWALEVHRTTVPPEHSLHFARQLLSTLDTHFGQAG